MTIKHIFRIIWGMLLTSCIMGGCECQRDVIVDEGPTIDKPALADVNPQVERPYTHFPSELHTEDLGLNRFVENALKTCEKGDYDAFRQLFGTSYTPTEYEAFDRVWRNVGEIRVKGLGTDKTKTDSYYLYAVVKLRKADDKDRVRRDAVLTIFKESGEWRLGPAPKEIVQKVLGNNQEAPNGRKSATSKSP